MDKHLKTAEFITELMDNKFNILGFKFGLDPILGLFYGAGGVISFFLSLYLIWIALEVSMPREKLIKMIRNVVIDFLMGLIPVVGQAGDFFYKANSKNLKILKTHMPVNIVEGKII